jgi:hypothetical protein
MRLQWLFSLKTLSIMLLLCFLLTTEETIHLLRSRPNEIDWSRTINHHPGCTVLDTAGRVLRCPVRGYGEMNLLCSAKGCVSKEPSTGLYISAAENKLLERHTF